MNSRERFQKIMRFAKCDRTLKWEFGYWFNALNRWYEEGLPEYTKRRYINLGQTVYGEFLANTDINMMEYQYEGNINQYFNLDKRIKIFPLNYGFVPPFKEEIINNYGEDIIKTNEFGQTIKIKKDNMSMPQYLGYPVSTEKDFSKIKMRLGIDIKKRLPDNIGDLLIEFEKRDYALGLMGVGYFNALRRLLGLENMLFYFYDKPNFIKEIMDYYTEYYIALFKKVIGLTSFDFFFLGEDMAFKSGSFISPQIFKEFFIPRYKKISKFIHNNISDIFLIDSDGDCNELIPMFIESGINGLFPLEVNANMDIVKLRKKFPKFCFLGGINKLSLINGKKEIDNELKKVKEVIGSGGYIPFIDHLIPPEVSFSNLKYYRNKLNDLILANKIL